MSQLKYIALAIDHEERPTLPIIGVLKPVLADGFYSNKDSAKAVAEYMKEENPNLRVYVVEVKERL